MHYRFQKNDNNDTGYLCYKFRLFWNVKEINLNNLSKSEIIILLQISNAQKKQISNQIKNL